MKETYFDTDLEPEASPLPELHPDPEEDAPEAEVKDGNPTPKRPFMGHDLSTLLIAGGVLGALLVYALWPDEPPQHTFVADPPATQVTVPVMRDAPPPDPEPLSPAESAPPQRAEPVQPTASPVNAQALQQASAANQESINALNGRVSDAERRLAEIEARLKVIATGAISPPNAASPPVKRTVVKTPSAHRTSQMRSGTISRQRTGVQGWRVHTIYPGMAWITHGGSTWSVQTGDSLNGMTIRSINATARTVTTDRGVIRQGG